MKILKQLAMVALLVAGQSFAMNVTQEMEDAADSAVKAVSDIFSLNYNIGNDFYYMEAQKNDKEAVARYKSEIPKLKAERTRIYNDVIANNIFLKEKNFVVEIIREQGYGKDRIESDKVRKDLEREVSATDAQIYERFVKPRKEEWARIQSDVGGPGMETAAHNALADVENLSALNRKIGQLLWAIGHAQKNNPAAVQRYKDELQESRQGRAAIYRNAIDNNIFLKQPKGFGRDIQFGQGIGYRYVKSDVVREELDAEMNKNDQELYYGVTGRKQLDQDMQESAAAMQKAAKVSGPVESFRAERIIFYPPQAQGIDAMKALEEAQMKTAQRAQIADMVPSQRLKLQDQLTKK
jgi:hypothetical protein